MMDRRVSPSFLRAHRIRRLSPAAMVSLAFALACSDRVPTTSPLPPQSTAQAESARTGPAKPTARTVAARGGAPAALQGVWGGDHIGLTIMNAAADVDYDCAGGSIDAPFVTDSAGHFDLPGTWWFTPPVLMEGWQPDKRPARYSGILQGDTMLLTVRRLDDGEVMQFTLVFERFPRVVHCL